MKEQLLSGHRIYLSPEQWTALKEHTKTHTYKTTSSLARYIIQTWLDAQQATPAEDRTAEKGQ